MQWKHLVPATVILVLVTACKGPTFGRDGDDPDIDRAAMSTGLDRTDLEKCVDEWYEEFLTSRVMREASPSNPTSISVLQIRNNTSERISGAMENMISSIETKLVNDGVFDVIEKDTWIADEVVREIASGPAVNPSTAARAGLRLGVKHLIYGDVGETAEKTADRKRVQYYVFLKVVEVETAKIVFQQQINRTKDVRK